MLKTISRLTLTMCFLASMVFAGEPAAMNTALTVAPATTTEEIQVRETDSSFPLEIKGKEITINQNVSQKDMETILNGLLGEKTAMEEKSRLQYDFQVSENTAPMALVIDFGKAGKIEQIILDALSEEENVPAQILLKWLKVNAGEGKQGTGDNANTTEWQYHSWNFVFTNGGDGEDSAYSFRITPIEEKK